MLLSIGSIILVSLALTSLFQKIKIPGIIAMILTGILLGPFVLNLIDPQILNLSPDLRQIALIIILIRAGLSVDIKDLKKVGRPAILLSFIPSTIEIIIVALLSHLLFQLDLVESLILGSIVAAISPAAIVPRMIQLIQSKRGTKKAIPQMILAASSLEDIYVITLFAVFIQIYQSNQSPISVLVQLPLSIISGALMGILVGYILVYLFKVIHMRDTIKVLVLFGVSFLMVYLETILKSVFPFSGLLSVMVLGGTILKLYPDLSSRLTLKFSKIWIGAEIMLFVLVGAIMDITVLKNVGIYALILLVVAMSLRIFSAYLITINTELTIKERLFIGFSSLPKATVQAAIGSIPLALGIPGGEIMLSVAVLAILITTPIGTILIDSLAEKVLELDSIM